MTVGKKIRVLIVDDSAFMRKVLSSIVTADPGLDVAGEAKDGREAVALAQSSAPDVITMDINMPHMDGLQATEAIMASNPKPIVIVSSESRDGADITLKALELGAIDFVAKPSSGVDLDMNTVREELCRKLRLASKVRVVRTASKTRLAQEIATSAPRTDSTLPSPYAASKDLPKAAGSVFGGGSGVAMAKASGRFPVVVIACSTGGPATLMKLVPSFPKDFPGAVILVQHMPGTFTSQFSEQLQEVASIKVKHAEPGEILAAGTFYVCPGSHHLRVSQTGRITLDEGARINGYRPCCDIALETTAEYAGNMSVGVVLTGMGSDGARGVQAVKAAGGHVIAQDEATSVIFGMNAAAIKTGAVDQIVPLDGIYTAIEKRVLYIYGAAKVGAL
jgi:two-component system chemotaxis response regulator CheB